MRKILGMAVVLCGFAASGHAQVNTSEGARVPGHDFVNKVNEHQTLEATLVADGVQAGQLTTTQADDFKRQMNAIQVQKISDMTQDHGHLTEGDFRGLREQQTTLERAIRQGLKKS